VPAVPAVAGFPALPTHAPSLHSVPLPQSELRTHAAPPQPANVAAHVVNALTSTAPRSRLQIDIHAYGEKSPKEDGMIGQVATER